jgi:hypothetical protein
VFRGHRLVELSRSKVEAWIADQTTSGKRILNLMTLRRQAVRYAVAQKRLTADLLGKFKVQQPMKIREDIANPLPPAEIAAAYARGRTVRTDAGGRES